MMIALFLAAAVATLPSPIRAEPVVAAAHPSKVTESTQVPHTAARAGDYPYQLFLPRGYAASGRQRWPLMIFLHGSGERGADLEKIKAHGPPKIVADHPGFPFILVSPQLAEGGTWDTPTLDRLLTSVRRAYRVDPSRIYLTGLSLGGHGTWDWAIARPDLFAAIAPVAGKGDYRAACRIKDVPVWAFHGDNDDVVPPIGSFAMVEAVRACHGSVAPRLTIYPATNHESWVPAYDDPALYRWLLEQRRAVPAPEGGRR